MAGEEKEGKKKRPSSFDPPERNPEVEALQAALNDYRKRAFELPDPEVASELGSFIYNNQLLAATSEREILAFLGIPGSGKSKLIEKVSRRLSAPVFHVRDLVKVRADIKKDEERYYRSGELLPGIEEEFLNLVFNAPEDVLLIDGFPRSILQSLMLYKRATQQKVSVTIVETCLEPGREVFQSYYRQMNQASHRERKGLLFGSALEIEHGRMLKKIQRALDLDLYVIDVLRRFGADILQLDATQGPSKMLKQLRLEIGDTDDADEGAE